MNRTNGLAQAAPKMHVGQTEDHSYNTVSVKTDQALVEKMASTANRLDNIEGRIGDINNWLFGPEPTNGQEAFNSEPNALSQANRAYYSVERIESMLDYMYRRLASDY